jgi:hypothetical protein
MKGIKMTYEEFEKTEKVIEGIREKTQMVRQVKRWIKKIEEGGFVGIELIKPDDRGNVSISEGLKWINKEIVDDVIGAALDRFKSIESELVLAFNNNSIGDKVEESITTEDVKAEDKAQEEVNAEVEEEVDDSVVNTLNVVRYSCNVCGSTFGTPEEVKKHFVHCSNRPELKRCETCRHKGELYYHMGINNHVYNCKVMANNKVWPGFSEPCSFHELEDNSKK